MTQSSSSPRPAPYAVIMAGGSGTRFWPASRRARPKQLLPLGGGEQSLLAATVERITPLVDEERILVVTAARLLDETREALRHRPGIRILAEPAARNTAPCVGWAAEVIARTDPDAPVMVLPSDHAIADGEGFRATLQRALDSAATGRLTVIGIVPDRAETGYGYIEVGEGQAGLFAVRRFVEKPDLARAQEFLAGKKHWWNAGMFFFRAGDMVAAIARHLPDMAAGLRSLGEAAGRADEQQEVERIFPTLQSISLDHGVLEKSSDLAVVPGDFGWNDVGSWQSAWELAQKDGDGNALPAGSLAADARDNLVASYTVKKAPRVVALVGVSDLCVVETDDAILVVPREKAQDVRKIIAALEVGERTDLL